MWSSRWGWIGIYGYAVCEQEPSGWHPQRDPLRIGQQVAKGLRNINCIIAVPWDDGVVPFGMEGIGLNVEACHLGIGDFDTLGVGVGVELVFDAQAGLGGRGGDQLDDGLRLTSGRPRQFLVMWLNRRCSILFHFLVPGGKWHTVMLSPISSASFCSSSCHSRDAVAVAAAAVGGDQQRRGARIAPAPSASTSAGCVATANSAVSR